MRQLRSLMLAATLPVVVGQGLQGTAARAADTQSLGIAVEVTSTCKLGTGSLDFGTYAAGQRTDVRAQGTIAFEGCAGMALTIGLDGGQSGNIRARRLVNADGEQLNYQLYRNSARTQVFGTDGDAAAPKVPSSGAGNVTVFGTIPGGQSIAVGRYTDTVTVTLDF